MDFPSAKKPIAVPDLKWMVEDVESKKFTEDKIEAIRTHIAELQALTNLPTPKVLLSKMPKAREQLNGLHQAFTTMQIIYTKADNGFTLLAREEQNLKDAITKRRRTQTN